MRSVYVIALISVLVLSSATSPPDRMFNDSFYLYFENKYPDGVSSFKIPVEQISADTLEKYNAFKRCGLPVLDISSNYNPNPQLAIYDRHKKTYLLIPLPFPHGHSAEGIGIQNKGDTITNRSTYLISGYERIYGSGGGTSYGGTIIISHIAGEDSITVHFKILDYLSEEAFGRFGSKYSFNEYARPLVVENGKLFVLPLDSSIIPNNLSEIKWFTNMNAGVYKMVNGRILQQSTITID